jgi:hypothetical protein
MNTFTDSMTLLCVNYYNNVRQFFAEEERVKEKCVKFLDWGTKASMGEQ